MIYLDNNATTLLDPDVLRVMTECWTSGPLNVSSQHAYGHAARRRFDQALTRIARLLGADIERPGGDQLLVTSGGSESNHWAIHGLASAEQPRWVSAIEHPSILAAGDQFSANRIPVNKHGVVDPDVLREVLSTHYGPNPNTPSQDIVDPSSNAKRSAAHHFQQRGLVSVMAANNETGVLQDIPSLAKVCHGFGVLLHTDATQWVGKLRLNFLQLGADAITFAAHKVHGPAGIGGLLLRPGLKIHPLIRGGQQQLGLRAGTEPVALVVGAQRALELAMETLDAATPRIAALRNQFEETLTSQLPDCVIHAGDADRLPGTSCIAFPGVDRQALLLRLDRSGVACSTGSACSSGSSEPSHVLKAMGVPQELVDASLRFALSRFSTAEEVAQATVRIVQCVNKLRIH